MSGSKAVHTLVDIVCKGGNLLFNVAPGPDGKWQEGAYTLLEEMGEWIDVNGEAIYGTRAIAPYKESNIRFTNKKNTNTVYAIYLVEENENMMPDKITIKSFVPTRSCRITLLGSDVKLKWNYTEEGIVIEIPRTLRNLPPGNYAWSFRIENIQM